MTAKRQCALTVILQSESEIGLLFGLRRRELPLDIEFHALSWLFMEDITNLFLASHSMSARVQRFLRICHDVHFDPRSEDRIRPANSLAARLAMRYCRSL